MGRTFDGNAAIRAAKNLRNGLVDHGFRCWARAGGRRLADELSARGIRHAVFTIAFNSPWVVDLLTHAWSCHQPDLPLVVIDNSSQRMARAAHADLCRRRRVCYLSLPWNPEWSPNRSHGIALNWAWFNVIRHVDLEFAGFVDHDCIPVAAFDLRRRMRDLDAYGLYGASVTHAEAWNLWPGYCFVRLAAAMGRCVDFKHRIEYGLDTGGGNWRGFYRTLPPGRVGAAASRWVRPDLGADGMAGECLLLEEAFLHLGGASYMTRFREPSLRQRFAEAILERRLMYEPAEPPGSRPAHR